MRGRVIAEILVVALAVSLLAWARHADIVWFLRHWSLDTRRLWVAQVWRWSEVGVAAALAVVVRPRVGRWVERVGASEVVAWTVRIAFAVVLALGASELILRAQGRPKKHDLRGSSDPEMNVPDPRLGWVWKGPYTRTTPQAGRSIDFAFDEHHDRVRAAGDAEDPERPTVLLVGESIVAGHGLPWDESLAGLIGAALDLQVVTLGVVGYGCDQAFVRLFDALPRFRHVVAVVTIFFPALVDRVGWIDRPRLAFDADQPVVSPAWPGFWRDLRVIRVLNDLLPYRDEASIELTGEIFRQTARLARARGARALFLTPHLGRGRPRGDGYLIDDLLSRQGLEVVDPDWAFEPLEPGDVHPNARATRTMAAAVVKALRGEPP
jgi:hypothetical protein